MKKALLFILTIGFCNLVQLNSAVAQTSDQIKSAEKDAKKRNKEMEKEGWKTQAGPSLFDMLKKMYLMSSEVTDINGSVMNRYVMANGNGVAGTLASAQRNSITKAKEEIILTIKSSIKGYVENVMANVQMSNSSAVTTDEMVSKFITMSAGELNNAITVVNTYRMSGENYEVSTVVMYDIVKATKDEIIKKLKERIKDDPTVQEDIKKVQAVGVAAHK